MVLSKNYLGTWPEGTRSSGPRASHWKHRQAIVAAAIGHQHDLPPNALLHPNDTLAGTDSRQAYH
jgi:hypothetical protein